MNTKEIAAELSTIDYTIKTLDKLIVGAEYLLTPNEAVGEAIAFLKLSLISLHERKLELRELS